MGAIMQVAGMMKRRKYRLGVSLPAFFKPPPIIGPKLPPRPKPTIVETFYLKKPENRERHRWDRETPIGHFFREQPLFLSKLRDGAQLIEVASSRKLQLEQGEEVEEADVQEVEATSVEASAASMENAGEGDAITDDESEDEADQEDRRPPPIIIPDGGFLPLWNLRDNPGSRKKKMRVGRGIGSGKGKTCGRGHKGQKSRSGRKPKLGFEGGQTPLHKRLPRKRESRPLFDPIFKDVSLADLKEYIDKGKIDPSKLITMKTLNDSRLSGKYIKDGVRIRGSSIDIPIHLEVSRCSAAAKRAIEEAGGTVRKVHYNKLGMKALIDPLWFKKKGRLLPKAARPKPKIAPLVDAIGRLPAPSSPILPEGFVLKAPVYGYPWPPKPDATTTEQSKNDTGGET